MEDQLKRIKIFPAFAALYIKLKNQEMKSQKKTKCKTPETSVEALMGSLTKG
jgi:hypothetical protein